MRHYTKLLVILVFCTIVTPVLSFAQVNKAISGVERDIRNEGGQMLVDIDIQVKDLDVPANEYITITPTLINNTGQSQEFAPVILNGSTAQKRYNRSLALNGEIAEEYRVVKIAGKHNQQTIPYRSTAPYQSWMENSDLLLVVETCDCGKPAETYDIFVANLTPVVFPVFTTTYIEPPLEAIKKREITGEAFVIFQVNKTVLMPELANNDIELQKIRQSMDYVREEKDFTIESITIEAFASPEGPLNNNIRLSEGRAAALKNYIVSYYNIDNNLISVYSQGENWSGLAEAVKTYDFTEKQKEDILDIIALDNENTRKTRLKAYEGGRPYQQLLANVYPGLRKSVYRIHYEVPAFSLERAREILQTKPGTLSLNEIYMVANSYDKNSEEFKNVFDVAVRLYPQDPVANLNAGALELEKNDPVTARKYLGPYIGDSHSYNNIGILYAQENQLDDARQYFEMAADRGDKNAADNLQKLLDYRRKSGN